MKTLFYYAALNPKGSSALIVERIKEKLTFQVDFRNVIEKPNPDDVGKYDCLIFLVATYGDQELQEDIERFLISVKQDLTDKTFFVCELGNYYGYDDFSFGSGQIVENYLALRNAKRLAPLSSVDTLPKMDWKAIDHWIDVLNQNLKNQS